VLKIFPELRPTTFKSDYEKSPVLAVREVYPGVRCEGDSFHMVQAVYKQLQKKGLAKAYRADMELNMQVGGLHLRSRST
jgi:hypothetical protein